MELWEETSTTEEKTVGVFSQMDEESTGTVGIATPTMQNLPKKKLPFLAISIATAAVILVAIAAKTFFADRASPSKELSDEPVKTEYYEEPQFASTVRYQLVTGDVAVALNEQNRVQNTADFAEENGWLYGSSWDETGSWKFYRMRSDFTDKLVLDDGYATNIYLVGDNIYYVLHDGQPSICRVKRDGTGREQLITSVGQMQIVGNVIYYTDTRYSPDNIYYRDDDEANYHLFRCDLNGRNKTELISRPVFYVFVFDDSILYQDDRDNESLHLCDLNGANDVKLNNAASSRPIYDGYYIYYLHTEAGRVNGECTIWRIKPDGTDEQQVSYLLATRGLWLQDDDVYFINAEDGYKLYCFDKNGSSVIPVTQDGNVEHVVLLSHQIKYGVYTNNYEKIRAICFCRFDGTDRQQLTQ